MGQPGLPPGIYFRLLLIGYFEGIDSERMLGRHGAALTLGELTHYRILSAFDPTPRCL